MKQWFDIKKIKDDAAEITIFDEIGDFGCTVSDFNLQFNEVKNMSSVQLLLNSPGGNVTEGIAIYNILSSIRDKLSIEVLGLAGSIASVIALAGRDLIMDEGTYLMIHDPSMVSMGKSNDLRRDADLLDKIKGQIVSIYNNRTGIDNDKLNSMMMDETWLDANEALELKFCTKVNDGKQIENNAFSKFNLSEYKKVPKNIVNRIDTSKLTARELEKQLRDEVGFSNSDAKKIASLYFKDNLRDVEETKKEDSSVLADLLSVL